jgi:hypothetical protein
MTPFRALIVALLLAIVFTGSNMWTKRVFAERVTVLMHPRIDTTSVLDEVAGVAVKPGPPRDDDWAEPRVDLNGNEIDDAVGDYRVDRRGEMYERHAPDTALLHLGAPRL